jgi:hypothetical protein
MAKASVASAAAAIRSRRHDVLSSRTHSLRRSPQNAWRAAARHRIIEDYGPSDRIAVAVSIVDGQRLFGSFSWTAELTLAELIVADSWNARSAPARP